MGQPRVSVSCGGGHTAVLDDGALYPFGYGRGRLGHATRSTRHRRSAEVAEATAASCPCRAAVTAAAAWTTARSTRSVVTRPLGMMTGHPDIAEARGGGRVGQPPRRVRVVRRWSRPSWTTARSTRSVMVASASSGMVTGKTRHRRSAWVAEATAASCPCRALLWRPSGRRRSTRSAMLPARRSCTSCTASMVGICSVYWARCAWPACASRSSCERFVFGHANRRRCHDRRAVHLAVRRVVVGRDRPPAAVRGNGPVSYG